MSKQTDFSRLKSQYDLHLTLFMETPLRIGVSKKEMDYSISSAPVLLSYNAENKSYTPFIPGSSLKGVLRYAAERLLKTNFYRGDWKDADNKTKEIIDGLFGSMGARSKVTVRDFYPVDSGTYWKVKDRPHVNPQNRNGRRKPNFRTEEVVEPIEFGGIIRVDNPDEKELLLLNMAINEFHQKRLFIGGGSSRGTGFVSPTVEKVVRKTVDGLEVTEEEVELPEPALNNNYVPLDRKDFDVYSTSENRGAVVCEFDVECLTDFQMPGVGEKTVTVNDLPVIPGSTIKGFLRRTFSGEINDVDSPRWDDRIIDDVFGSINGGRAHASRVYVSDAFFWDESEAALNDYIPKGSELTCWIFFDNMEFTRIKEIVSLLGKGNRITGKKIAENGGNRVRFSLSSAWRYMPDDPEKDVFDEVNP